MAGEAQQLVVGLRRRKRRYRSWRRRGRQHVVLGGPHPPHDDEVVIGMPATAWMSSRHPWPATVTDAYRGQHGDLVGFELEIEGLGVRARFFERDKHYGWRGEFLKTPRGRRRALQCALGFRNTGAAA